jgi:hypothetical protein
MEAIIFLVALVALSLATTRWGSDSRETFNSAEWEKRRRWRSAHASSRPR